MNDPDLSVEQLFELKLAFLRELASGYRSAREAQEQFLRNPADPKAVAQLASFFHSIAGTAQMVQLPTLGHLAAISERVANEVEAGRLSDPKTAAQLFKSALAGVAAELDSHGTGAVERPLPGSNLDLAGLAIPQALGEGRELAKILVVDDDKFSAELIDNCLRSTGFMSSYYCNSKQALEVIESELPDLIILDVVMPGIDGFELCRRVRQHPALQFTPIIFVTRKDDVEQRVRGLEVGGNDYVSKPFEPQELVARVRSHLVRLAALREMAVRDGLTHCYNHKFFRIRLNQEIDRAMRYDQPLALAMVDIDHFKAVNDTYGHRAGDTVLSHLGNIIAAATRATDVVARYGGDEFAILMAHAGAEEAQIVCSRLCERIAQHEFRAAGDGEGLPTPVVDVTVSVGMGELLPNDDTAEKLIVRADKALYAAKAAGRNCVRLAEQP
jgi:diguanylate cyclase (GGDEF)-like protein